MKNWLRLLAAAAVLGGFIGYAFAQQTVTATATWNAVPEPVTGYKLYQSTVSGAYGAGVDVGKVTSYIFTLPQLSVAQMYFFTVTASNIGGESLKSVETSFTVAALPPPVLPAPANYKAVVTGQTVTFTWDAVPGAVAYSHFVHLAGTPYQCGQSASFICSVNITTRTLTMTLVPGVYDIWVRGNATLADATGTTAGSGFTVLAPPVIVVPPAPAGLTVR